MTTAPVLSMKDAYSAGTGSGTSSPIEELSPPPSPMRSIPHAPGYGSAPPQPPIEGATFDDPQFFQRYLKVPSDKRHLVAPPFVLVPAKDGSGEDDVYILGGSFQYLETARAMEQSARDEAQERALDRALDARLRREQVKRRRLRADIFATFGEDLLEVALPEGPDASTYALWLAQEAVQEARGNNALRAPCSPVQDHSQPLSVLELMLLVKAANDRTGGEVISPLSLATLRSTCHAFSIIFGRAPSGYATLYHRHVHMLLAAVRESRNTVGHANTGAANPWRIVGDWMRTRTLSFAALSPAVFYAAGRMGGVAHVLEMLLDNRPSAASGKPRDSWVRMACAAFCGAVHQGTDYGMLTVTIGAFAKRVVDTSPSMDVARADVHAVIDMNIDLRKVASHFAYQQCEAHFPILPLGIRGAEECSGSPTDLVFMAPRHMPHRMSLLQQLVKLGSYLSTQLIDYATGHGLEEDVLALLKFQTRAFRFHRPSMEALAMALYNKPEKRSLFARFVDTGALDYHATITELRATVPVAHTSSIRRPMPKYAHTTSSASILFNHYNQHYGIEAGAPATAGSTHH